MYLYAMRLNPLSRDGQDVADVSQMHRTSCGHFSRSEGVNCRMLQRVVPSGS